MNLKKTIIATILIILALFPIMASMDGQFTLLIFSIFVLVWLIAPKLKPIIKKIPSPLFVKFLILGIIFALITEYLVFLDSGIDITGTSGLFSQNPIPNLILAMGIYVSLILVWYFLLKNYKFNLAGVFISAGIWGVVIEQDFAVLLSFNLLAYLYIFATYGSFVSIPFLLTNDDFNEKKRKEKKIKYVVAFFTQFIAYILGTLWILSLRIFSA